MIAADKHSITAGTVQNWPPIQLRGLQTVGTGRTWRIHGFIDRLNSVNQQWHIRHNRDGMTVFAAIRTATGRAIQNASAVFTTQCFRSGVHTGSQFFQGSGKQQKSCDFWLELVPVRLHFSYKFCLIHDSRCSEPPKPRWLAITLPP